MALKMIHPEIESVAEVVDADTFNAVWAPRGWELLGEREAYAAELLGKPVHDASKLTADELRALVAYRGGEYPAASAKKADVLDAYKTTFTGEFVPAGAAVESEDTVPDGRQPTEQELADQEAARAAEAEEAKAQAEADAKASNQSAPAGKSK